MYLWHPTTTLDLMAIRQEARPAPNPPADDMAAHPPESHARMRRLAWACVLVAGPLLMALLVAFPQLDQPRFHSALGHLLIAGAAALLGAALALQALHVAVRAADARVFLVGMGFLSVASIFFIHALATPDVVLTGRGVATAWSGSVSLALGGVFFALSGMPIGARLNARVMASARALLVVFLAGWLLYSWVVLVAIPTMQSGQAVAQASAHPHDERSGLAAAEPLVGPILSQGQIAALRNLVMFGGLACYALALWRHIALYRRDPSDAALAIIGGIGLLGEALLTQRFWVLYGSTFWLSHAQEFAGFGAISYAVLRAYRRGDRGESLLESLFLTNTRARIQADYAGALDALADTLARGEQPSPALRGALRQRLGLSDGQVRVFGQAAQAIAQERRQRHELERLNAELRQLEGHRDQLTQLVVHDLKNPLTALIGYLDLLRMSGLSDEQHEFLRRAQLNGYNLSAQINDLLYISQLEEGKLELERTLFVPHALLDECAAQMQAWVAQEQQHICVEAAGAMPYYGDTRLLRRVLLNLISNAIKHNPPGTQIVLSAFRPEPSPSPADGAPLTLPALVFAVRDTGRGILPEQLDHIFEKYGRGSTPSPTRQTSSGLGLTLCRLVAEAHGGAIAVESVVDAGSVFTVTLPAVQAPDDYEQ
jgi:two-component system OmpR family sensor kinase